MNQGYLVLKAAFPLNTGQLLDVHLYPVTTYGQVIFWLFVSLRLGELFFLQNPEYRAPVGKRVGWFEFLGNANRTVMRIGFPVVQHRLPVGLRDYSG